MKDKRQSLKQFEKIDEFSNESDEDRARNSIRGGRVDDQLAANMAKLLGN
jgi:hypothetical protein